MSITRRTFISTSGALAAAAHLTPTRVEAATQTEASGSGDRQRPNIVLVILDDVGFGDLGCYGSEIPTRCIDSLAAKGACYNNFHVTSLCAPTRASLLTGRNAHAVGVGNIGSWGRDLPGYRGFIRKDVSTLPEVLRPTGYSNFAVGKWHLADIDAVNAAGPHDQWPTGRGFDQWYGFHGATADHWYPELFRNNYPHHPEVSGGDYHLTEDLIDQSIGFVSDHIATTPEQPYFLYLAFGACHYPYHVPRSHMHAHRGRYDDGWDVIRARRFARQMEIGIVPPDATMSERSGDVPAWTSLSANERKFSARTQEAFAAFLHHTDDQLGRLVDFLDTAGQLESTLILVMSDNGAGSWGPPAGRLDVHRAVLIEPEPLNVILPQIDKVGSWESHPSYSPGWAQVSNTPLKLFKGDTFEGGIRAPLIAHWPGGGIEPGAIRTQYHHVSDIMPTILDIAGIEFSPLDGTSLRYTFANGDAPSRKTVQFYETAGDRALWANGWKAVTNHTKGDDFSKEPWHLYHADRDFAEIKDLARQHPQRLAEMIAMWQVEARRNDVLPMADDVLATGARNRAEPRRSYVFYPNAARLNARNAPDIRNYDFEITAEVDLRSSSKNGVIVASGDSMAGYAFEMRDGRVEFTYVYVRETVYRLRSRNSVAAGEHRLTVEGIKSAGGSTRVRLIIDGAVVDALDLPEMWEVKNVNAGLRIGANPGAPIAPRSGSPEPFGLELEKVTFELAT